MEELEVPMEDVHKHIEEHAHKSGDRWTSGIALVTAILAALAAVAALLAGDHANEAMIAQIQASDHWNHYQAKGIKSGQLSSKIEILTELGHTPKESDNKKLDDYAKDQNEIHAQAEEAEKDAHKHLRTHVILARSVTLFQIAITLSAICLLTKRRVFAVVAWGVGVVGAFSFAWALLT